MGLYRYLWVSIGIYGSLYRSLRFFTVFYGSLIVLQMSTERNCAQIVHKMICIALYLLWAHFIALYSLCAHFIELFSLCAQFNKPLRLTKLILWPRSYRLRGQKKIHDMYLFCSLRKNMVVMINQIFTFNFLSARGKPERFYILLKLLLLLFCFV